MPADTTSEWNMNLRYLDFVMLLIITYGDARLGNDFDKMYSSLKLLESTISPKVDNDIVEDNLKIARHNLKNMITKNPDSGEVLKYYPRLIDETVDLLDDTYALLLQKLEKKGILTNQKRDPREAMGKFSGS